MSSVRTALLWLLAVSGVAFAQITPGPALTSQQGTLANIPVACSLGQLYFATDQTAGANVYGCTVSGNPGTWTLEASGGTAGGPANVFRYSFCGAGTCNNDATTFGIPAILSTGTQTLSSCKALFYGVIPSSTITLDVRKNSTTSSNGTELLSSAWTFSTATLGTTIAYSGGFAAVTISSGDQVAIYFTGTSGQGLTVVCQ